MMMRRGLLVRRVMDVSGGCSVYDSLIWLGINGMANAVALNNVYSFYVW